MSDLAHKMEVGTVSTNGGNGDADEAELARMGYKQELKYVTTSSLLAIIAQVLALQA